MKKKLEESKIKNPKARLFTRIVNADGSNGDLIAQATVFNLSESHVNSVAASLLGTSYAHARKAHMSTVVIAVDYTEVEDVRRAEAEELRAVERLLDGTLKYEAGAMAREMESCQKPV